MKSKVFRIYLKTWRRWRKIFPGIKDETVADYVEQLSNYLINLERRYGNGNDND